MGYLMPIRFLLLVIFFQKCIANRCYHPGSKAFLLAVVYRLTQNEKYQTHKNICFSLIISNMATSLKIKLKSINAPYILYLGHGVKYQSEI